MQLRCLLLLVIHTEVVVKSQMIDENDAHMNAGFRGLEGNAFFALRSCHQVLHGNSGEFFSPDYLCSNPALWCNWTIQVDPDKRVQLYLEDLTPEHVCHRKMDQIHLDESPVAAGGTQILERCWQRARYTSISNTVHVVQLIGPNPSPPHRGFYGQYEAFGPLEPPSTSIVVDTGVINEDLLEEEEEEEEDEEMETVDAVTEVPDQKSFTGSTLADPVDVSQVTSYLTNELPVLGSLERNSGEIRKTRGGADDQATTDEGVSDVFPTDEYRPHSFDEEHPGTLQSVHAYSTHTIATPTSTPHVLSTKGVEQFFTDSATTANKYEAGPKSTPSLNESQPTAADEMSSPALNDSDDTLFVEMPLADSDRTLQTGAVEPAESFGENKINQNSARKPKPSHRTKGKALSDQTIRNPAEPPHLPRGLLLEVTVEVGVNNTHKERWDHIRSSFRSAVENMIQKDLEYLSLKGISSKRSKKLNAGVLLIVWVQFGEGDEEGLTLGDIQSTLHGLKGKTINSHDAKSRGLIISVSVEDVDECETQLVMCDVHAECLNQFGSYSCHCLHGYSPGLGGAICVKPEGEDCKRTLFPALLYVICVLLCFLIAVLLVVFGVLYRRYHRGAFLPRCHNSSTRSFTATDNNNNSDSGVNAATDTISSRPPPPPPPLRLSSEASTGLDLPLLKFTPLVPPEIFQDKLQRQKDQL